MSRTAAEIAIDLIRRRCNPDVARDEVFAAFDYEPNCLVRHAAAQAAGYVDVAAAKQARAVLPPMCRKCPQELFHSATESDVLYGGQAGGGKSLALVMEALSAAVMYPGIRIGVFRREYDELEESILNKIVANLSVLEEVYGARYTTSPHPDLKFANKSTIRFRHGRRPEDATLRQGGTFQLLLIDERALFHPTVVDMLVERVRIDPPGVPVLGVRSTSNPTGIGHAAVKKRYVDATEHGNKIVREKGNTIRFIPARLADNPYLHKDESYRARLDAMPDEHRRAAMRDGSWDIAAGQVFTEWRYDRHVVQPFDVPTSWRRIAGIDYGFRSPFAVAWLAIDQDGRVWQYREMCESEVDESEQARRILAAEAVDIGAPVSLRIADTNLWQHNSGGPSPADFYAAAGCAVIPAQKGPGSRWVSWQRLHSYLAEAPACQLHRRMGWTTCPMLHVFDCCTRTIETIPGLMYKGMAEEVDSDGDDHLPDALKYALNSLPDPNTPAFDSSSHRAPMTTRVTADEPVIPSPKMWDEDEPRERSVATMNF